MATTGIEDRSYIVTGGARGIGLAFVESLLALGASVGVVDLPPTASAAVQLLSSKYGIRCQYASADVSNTEQLHAALDKLHKEFGRVDGCVTAAGICVDKPFGKHTSEDFQRQLAINGGGTFFTVQWTVERLKAASKPGSIVMIASQAAQHVCPGHLLSAYAASKGAVLAFSRSLAMEVAAQGIRVNTISPGYIATDMNLSIARDRPELFRFFEKAPPLGRVGKVEDLTAVLLLLLSDQASYITGVDVPVDGGMSVSASGWEAPSA